jgi:hypothetical protein
MTEVSVDRVEHCAGPFKPHGVQIRFRDPDAAREHNRETILRRVMEENGFQAEDALSIVPGGRLKYLPVYRGDADVSLEEVRVVLAAQPCVDLTDLYRFERGSRVSFYLARRPLHAGAVALVFTVEDPRRDGYGGDVQCGVTFDLDSEDIDTWRDGQRRPMACVGLNPGDAAHYRFFRSAADREQAGFLPVHGDAITIASWSKYLRLAA